jgi:hypothetical protein
MADLETAVAVREAAAADGHDVEMVESPGDVESRLRPAMEEMALVLTGRLDETVASRLSGVFSGAIPRPPLLAVVPEHDPEELRRVARLFDLDDAIPAPPDPAEVQIALRTQLDRYRLQVETGIVGRTEAVREVLDRIHLIAPVNSTVAGDPLLVSSTQSPVHRDELRGRSRVPARVRVVRAREGGFHGRHVTSKRHV